MSTRMGKTTMVKMRKGGITIPWMIREDFAWDDGTVLHVEERGNEVVLREATWREADQWRRACAEGLKRLQDQPSSPENRRHARLSDAHLSDAPGKDTPAVRPLRGKLTDGRVVEFVFDDTSPPNAETRRLEQVKRTMTSGGAWTADVLKWVPPSGPFVRERQTINASQLVSVWFAD